MIINLKTNKKPKSATFQNIPFLENHKDFIDNFIQTTTKLFEQTTDKNDIDNNLNSEVNHLESISAEQIQEEIQNAYNQGFNDGQQTTSASFQAQIQQHQRWLKNLDSVISELQQQYRLTIAQLEESVIDLATMIAKYILQIESLSNSELVIEQARKAIKSLDNDTIFRIRLNPENVSVLEKAKSNLIKDSQTVEKVKLVADNSIEPGDCVLETSAGTIDARLTSQLEKIRTALKNNITNSPVEHSQELTNSNSDDSK